MGSIAILPQAVKLFGLFKIVPHSSGTVSSSVPWQLTIGVVSVWSNQSIVCNAPAKLIIPLIFDEYPSLPLLPSIPPFWFANVVA